MIELTVCQSGNTYSLTPRSIVIGNADSNGVVTLHFDLPSEFSGLTKRVTFKPQFSSKPFERFLNANNDVILDGYVTSSTGILTLDAYNDTKRYATTNVEYSIVPHMALGGSEEEYEPSTVESLVAQAVQASNQAVSSANASALSEVNAKESEDNAKTSEDNAKASENNAKAYELSAKSSMDNASASALSASTSASNASASESSVSGMVAEMNAIKSETIGYKNNASASASSASDSATSASNSLAEVNATAERIEESASHIDELDDKVDTLLDDIVTVGSEQVTDYTRINVKPAQSTFSVYTTSEIDAKIDPMNEDLITQKTRITHTENINKTQNYRLTNLEEMAKGNLYRDEVDSEVKREKVVPVDACQYAYLEKLGGMSRKCKQLFRYFDGNVHHLSSEDLSFQAYENGIHVTGSKPNTAHKTASQHIAGKTGTYIISTVGEDINSVYMQVNITKADGSTKYIVKNGTFTLDGTERSVIVNFQTTNTVMENVDIWVKCMLEESSVAHPYEPYTDQLIDAKVDKVVSQDADGDVVQTTNLPSSVLALTDYGIGINDTCYNYLAWEDGKVMYHQMVKSVDMGSFKCSYQSAYTNFVTPTFSDMANFPYRETFHTLCAKYDYSIVSQVSMPNMSVRKADDNNLVFVIRDLNYTDATGLKNALQGVMFYYELAEPIVTDVTSLFTEDFNTLEVEPNGTITFKYSNDDKYVVDMPNTVDYLIKLTSEVTSDEE